MQETELALFSVLAEREHERADSTVHGISERNRSFIQKGNTKASRQEEWRRFPLQTPEEIETWFKEKQQAAETVIPLATYQPKEMTEPLLSTSLITSAREFEQESPAISEPSFRARSVSVLDQLRTSTPPSAPNATNASSASMAWRNYF